MENTTQRNGQLSDTLCGIMVADFYYDRKVQISEPGYRKLHECSGESQEE